MASGAAKGISTMDRTASLTHGKLVAFKRHPLSAVARRPAALSAAASLWPTLGALFNEDFLSETLEGGDDETSQLLARVEAFVRSEKHGSQDLYEFRELLLEAAHSVSMRWRVLTQLRSMALTDELTGLYNRRGFLLLGMQNLRLAARSEQPLHLFFADVDCLKAVNDTHGHTQGDAFLVGCAEVLKMTFRESDIVARIGGDEFAILAQGGTEESGEAVLNRLDSSLRLLNRDVLAPQQLSLSVGAARFDPASPVSLSELLSIADREMFSHKRARANARSTGS
jgi:diguanylate cyclase (GGDEF)-like protein